MIGQYVESLLNNGSFKTISPMVYDQNGN